MTLRTSLGLVVLLLLLPQVSQAQWAVVDLDAIAQSVLEYKKQLDQYVQQVEQTRQQIRQTEQQVTMVTQGTKNLTKLNLNNAQDLLGLYRQLNSKLQQARWIGYQVARVQQQGQDVYNKSTGKRTAAETRQLERVWAQAQRDAAQVALKTQAIEESQQEYNAKWREVLNRAAAAEGNLQIQQAAVQAQGVTGSQLMAIEQQLATQAREQTQQNLRAAKRIEMEEDAMEATTQPMETTYEPQGAALTLSTGQGD